MHQLTGPETHDHNNVKCDFMKIHWKTERRVPELIPVLGSQPAGDVSHKPGGRLPLLSARPAAILATRQRAARAYQFCCLVNRGTMGVNSLPKTVTRQR